MPALQDLLLAPQWRRQWRAALLTLLLVVTVLAFMPDPPTPSLPQGDKLNHVLAFVTLAMVAVFAAAPGWRRGATAAAGLLLYGAGIEVVQAYLPWRSGEWLDLAADAFGIVLGLAAAAALRRLLSAGS